MQTANIYTIGELTKYIKHTFEEDDVLQDVWLRGELSNVKLHSRGHLYFTVKDESSRLQAVMFAGNNRFLKFRPEDGMKVLIRGSITVYEPYGQYQLYAKEMQPDGIGNLYLAYEELKAKLSEEGMFAEHIKKRLPPYPTRIAIITSPTGAAIRDIVTTIKRRNPTVKLTLLPVLVQGEGAAPAIARAIRQANEANCFDVLIVGRGGGSIEELWAFNEEMVAREIYASFIPVISAVGHETDITISDFVADVRAATPTAAAELAVPVIDELLEKIAVTQMRMIRAMKERIKLESQKVHSLQKSYAFRYPRQLVNQKEQELDRLIERLQTGTKRLSERKKDKLIQLVKDLEHRHPEKLMVEKRRKLEQLKIDLQRTTADMLKYKDFAFQKAIGRLKLLSPLQIMERGYSIVYRDNKQLVKSINDVKKDDELTVQFQDGSVSCSVNNIQVKQIATASSGVGGIDRG